MYKRCVFTTVTTLPFYIDRQMVVDSLQDHSAMIQLNPLVINHERCPPPRHCPADEYHCIWYEMTDAIKYFPGVSTNVSYRACFYDLPVGLQTHVYAPMGLDIREKWSVGGNMPGEPREKVELGLFQAPREGLYLREDVNMKCTILAVGFVKKTLRKAHQTLVDRLVLKADLARQNLPKHQEILSHHSTTNPSITLSQPDDDIPSRDTTSSACGTRGYAAYRPPVIISGEQVESGYRDPFLIPSPLRPLRGSRLATNSGQRIQDQLAELE